MQPTETTESMITRVGNPLVAQVFGQVYRRIPFCGAGVRSTAIRIFKALPIANRRYSGLKTCATMAAAFLFSAFISNGQINQSLGTLLPGEFVIMQYDVTITNQIPTGVTALTNQGTLSGGNFANVLTDDPSTASTNDATLTALDVPPVL